MRRSPEIKKIDEAIDKVLQTHEIAAYFTKEELQHTANEMVEVMKEVLSNPETLKFIEFHEGSEMAFYFDEKYIRIGLGRIKQMVNTWFDMQTGFGSVYMPREMIREAVEASLRRSAIHEVQHHEIDLNPVTEIGIPIETWGKIGMSSWGNAWMDNRVDQRSIDQETKYADDVRTGLEYKFGPNGDLDWVAHKEEELLKRGHVHLFNQASCEAIRAWAEGKIHSETDPRVRAVLEKHKDDILFTARDPKCVPKKGSGKLEIKAKARKVYEKVVKSFEESVAPLVEIDKNNQAVHQAISIVGLLQNGEEMHEKIKKLLEEKLETIEGQPIKKELEEKLSKQKEEKEEYDRTHPSVAAVSGETAEAVGTAMEEDSPGKTPEDYFDILGPAVPVEQLSEELREWLKKLLEELIEEMREEIMEQILQQIIQQLLQNPETILRQEEDELNEKLRPCTVPPSSPNHEEMEGERRGRSARPEQDEVEVVPPERPTPPEVVVDPDAIVAHPVMSQLEKYEKELDRLYDMEAKIEAWKEAIYARVHTGQRLTDDPTPDIDAGGLIHHLIRTGRGEEDPYPQMFLESAPEQEKITLSILWRTDGVRASEALKVMLFLKRIYEDNAIRRYLDLEILMAQPVEGFEQPSEEAEVPVVLSFDQKMEGADWERLLHNLLAIQKKDESEDATLHVVNGPLALKTQRERILRQNPGSKRRFVIDFWDELTGRKGEMNDIIDEISKTKEALHGKACCIVFDERGMFKNSPAKAYGEGNYLGVSDGKDLITYLDIVVRSMIQFGDDFAEKTKEIAKRELGVDIHEKLI